METLRAVLATLLFLGGIACLVHGLSGGPLGWMLAGAALCFLLAGGYGRGIGRRTAPGSMRWSCWSNYR